MTETGQSVSTRTDSSARPDDAVYAGQILDGAKEIAKYLTYLGFAKMTEKRVFHWVESGKLPVQKIGGSLISNKIAIQQHFGLRK